MLLSRIIRSLGERGLVCPGDRVLVAVSGGSDSMALLHLLLRVAPEMDLSLVVGHLDHGLRGEEGREDSRFVEDFARRWGLPVVCRVTDAALHARKERISPEMAARQLRYRFFAEAARETSAVRVTTGHTAEDLAETLLLFLLRGAGDSGLGGFSWRRPLAEGIELVRPLRDLRRGEILEYLSAHHVPFRTDSSNRDLRFTRNRIRHELLPFLEKRFNPRTVEALGRAADRWAEAYRHLSRPANEVLANALREREARKIALDAPRIGRYHECLRGRVLRAAFALLSPQPLSESHTRALSALIAAREGKLDLPGGIRATRRGELLLIACSDGETAEESAVGLGPTERAAGKGRVVSIPGLTPLDRPGSRGPVFLHSRLLEEGEERDSLPPWGPDPRPSRRQNQGRGPSRVFLDYEALELPLVARRPRAGDRMRPLGMGGTKKLQDILVDRKIPRHQRAGLWVVEDRRRIIWVVGVQRSEEAKLTARTRRVLLLEGNET